MIALATTDAIATVAVIRSIPGYDRFRSCIRLLRGIARQILASHVVLVGTCDLLRTLIRAGVVPLTRSRGPTSATAQVQIRRSSNADKAMRRSSSSAPLAHPVFETHKCVELGCARQFAGSQIERVGECQDHATTARSTAFNAADGFASQARSRTQLSLVPSHSRSPRVQEWNAKCARLWGSRAPLFKFWRCRLFDAGRQRPVIEHAPGAFNKLADVVAMLHAKSSVAREIEDRLFGGAQQRCDLLRLEVAVDPQHMSGSCPNTSDRTCLRSGLE
jgi:hypothetical protein